MQCPRVCQYRPARSGSLEVSSFTLYAFRVTIFSTCGTVSWKLQSWSLITDDGFCGRSVFEFNDGIRPTKTHCDGQQYLQQSYAICNQNKQPFADGYIDPWKWKRQVSHRCVDFKFLLGKYDLNFLICAFPWIVHPKKKKTTMHLEVGLRIFIVLITKSTILSMFPPRWYW